MSFLMVGLVVIMKPYRRTVHNVMDFIIFLLMTVIAAVPNVWVIISYPIMTLPILAMICYIFYCVIKCCCNACSAKQTETVHQPTSVDHTDLLKSAISSNVVLEDYYADRILNPSGYNEQHSPYKPLDESAPAEDDP